MRSAFTAAIFAFSMPTTTFAQNLIEGSQCLTDLEEAGLSLDLFNSGGQIAQQTDLMRVSKFGVIEQEYSMPREIEICHDNDRVYGLQLTLKMHRFKYRQEEESIKKYGLQNTFKVLDQTIKDSKPNLMSFIGSRDGECETQDIFSKGSVRHISVYSDKTGIRSFKMKLTDGEIFQYGQTADEVQNEDLVLKEFSFEQGKQLLGIHGKVAVNKKQNKMRLVSLGFFRDECSDTRTLYQSIGEV